MRKLEITKGDIWYAELPENTESVQKGKRPVIIVSNNICNKFSPTIQVVALTSELEKTKLPTHIFIKPEGTTGLKVESIALCEQIITINKKRLIDKIGNLDNYTLERIDKGMSIQLQLDRNTQPKAIIHTREEILDREHIEKCRKNIENLIKVYKILKTEDMKDSIVFSILELKKYCIKHKVNYNLYLNRYSEFLEVKGELVKAI